MLGYNHGMLGVAAFGASTWYAEHVVHLPALGIGDLAMGVVVAAGSALAPDLDEHESLAGRANPISDLPIFGGHRTRTHTLMMAALVLLVTLLCERDRTATAALVGFFACTGGSVLFATARHWGAMVSVPFGVLAGYLSYHYLSAGWWLIAAVALPYLSHLLADSLTVGGVPLLMPFTRHRFSLGLMKTGHFVERVVFTPLIIVAAVAACWVAFEPPMSQLGSYRFHELGAAGRGVLVASEHAPCGDQDLTLCASVAERVRFWDRPFGPGRACQLHSASFRVHPTPPDASRDRDDRHP